MKKTTQALLFISAMSSQLSFAEDSVDYNASLFEMSIQDLMNLKVTVASVFEESELDAASSVSLLTENDWQKTGAKRLSDVLESVPSVASYPTWGGAEAIAIRGFTTELSVRGIANTLNGVPLNSYTYATSLYDKPIINLDHLSRIEMVRGPGSTLYGSDAFHGVIARQLKDSNKDETQIRSKVGSDGYTKASLFVAQTFEDSILNAGLAFARQSDQNLNYRYTDPDDGLLYNSERHYAYRDQSGFIKLSAGKVDTGRVEFFSYYANYLASGFPSTGTQFFTRIDDNFDVQSTSLTEDREHSGQDSSFWLASLSYDYQLSDSIELGTQIYHWQSKQEWSFDNARYPISLVYAPNDIPITSFDCKDGTNTTNNPLYCPHTLYQSTNEQRSGAKLQLKGKSPEASTQWVLGAGYDRFIVNGSNYSRIDLNGSTLVDQDNPYKNSKRHIRYALFQAKTGLFNDKLHAVYGLRADDYSDVGSHLSPRAGLIVKVSENYSSKLLYGHAFRAPTAIERFGSVQAIEANESIKPEEIDTVEWVNHFLANDYSTELTLFSSRWKEGIVLVPTTGSSQKYFNTGRNESYGVELSGRKQFKRFELVGSSSYVRSKNKELNSDYLAFPKWIFTLQGNYLLADSNIELSIKQRAMLNYSEGDYITSTNPTTLEVTQIAPEDADDYFRTDLSLLKHFDSKSGEGERAMYINVNNIFDQKNTVASLYNVENGLADSGLSVDIGLSWSW